MPLRRLAAVLALSLSACASHAPPPAPAEPMPLPPASGSPIGYLVDDATHLGFTEDQLTRLRDIDASLSAHLEALDATDRAGSAPPPGQAPAGGHHGGRSGMHGGMRGGGGMSGPSGGVMGGGGSGGGVMGGGGPGGGGPGGGGPGGGHGHGGPGGGHGGPGGAGASIAEGKRLYVRDALGKAFAIMDAPQRARAKQVLADRGVDFDPTPPPPRGQPAEGESEP